MATLYVGTSEGYYATVTDAVAAANDGDTIIVKGSEYALTSEKVNVSKALTIQAEGNVTVDSFAIGTGTAMPQNIVIEGFTIKPSANEGIYQAGTNLTTLTVQDCVFDLTEAKSGTIGYGIHLDLNFSGTEKVTVDGCTFNGDNYWVTSAMRASYQSSVEFTNNVVNDISGHAVQLSLTGPVYEAYPEDAAVKFDGNTFTNIGSCAIYAADIKNDNVTFNVSNNEFTNINLNGGSQYWGAIRFGAGSVNGLTVENNTIVNGNVGIYQGVALKEGATGTISISGNDFALSDRPGFAASALNVYNSAEGAVSAGDFTGNEVLVLEPATNFIVDAAIEGKAGDIVTVDGKNYIVGTNAFTTLTDAVNAASATVATTITLAAGTYADDITLDARTMEQKGDIKFIAAEDATVTFTGKFTLGYYEKRVGSKAWEAEVAFEGITFNQAADATHSIDIQQVKDFVMTDCTLVGDGEYGMLGTNVDNGATITGSTFVNAGIQSAGNFGTDLVIDGCTFDESKVNIQSGNSVTIQNSTFDATVTDANVGDSFYCIRSNDNAIVILNTAFNIDSTVTGTAEDQEKWGVLWQRNAGSTEWTVSDIVVNFTDAALAQPELLFNKNGTTTEANEADRITIKGITSDADVADIIAKTEGSLIALYGSTYGVYYNGVLQDSCDLSKFLVNANITPDLDKYMPDYMLGVNAFASFTEALKNLTPQTKEISIESAISESATADKITVALTQDLTIDGTGKNIDWTSGSNWIWFKKADGVEGDVTVSFENFNLNASSANKTFFFGTDIAVDGNSSINIWNANIQATGKVNVAAGGEFNVAKEELQIQAGGSLNVTGYENFVAANAALADRQVFLQYSRNVYGDINVTDSYMAIFQDIRLKDDATFTADNALIQFGIGADGVWAGNPIPNGYGNLIVNGANSVFTLQNGSILEITGNVTNNGTINIDNSTFLANGTLVSDGAVAEAYNKGVVTNNGTILVSGESTLNIRELAGSSIDLLDGAIVKNSTVGGAAFIAGNVTFRGDNSFTMITDFGTLTDYYGTTAPMAWTVEAGASLTLTDKARYGLGYGDKVVINGNIAEGGAAAARATLTDDDTTNDVKQSLFMHGLVAQESKGWNCNSSFTVNNAFVTIGDNNSFGNKPGNYGGTYTFSINNSVVNSSRITFYEALSKTAFTFKDSDVKIGQFMTRDQDSVFTLDNTTLLSTSTVNGNDEGNYNAGTLNVINGSTLTYSIKMSNEATGIINVNNATLNAPEVDNKGIVEITGTSTVGATIANSGSVKITGDASVGTLNVTGNAVELNATLVGDSTITGNALVNANSAIAGTAKVTGVTKVANGSTLTVNKGATFNGSNLAAGNDNYFGFGENAEDAKGGTIDINGNVVVNQVNADANGVVNVNKGGSLKSAEICIENGEIADADSGVLNIAGEAWTASLRIFNNGTVNVSGTLDADHADNVSTQQDISIWGGGKLNINGGSVNVDESMTVGADSAMNINSGKLAVKQTLTNNGTVNVTGESTLSAAFAGNGTINIADANLTASKIQKGAVNFKGDNTFSGDFNASTAYVGDWTNDSYTGSVDFGTDSNVNIGSQMIIGYDYSAMGSNNVVFGDVTGKVVTDKVFKAADVSVRRDGTLTIANTTGDNKINTMNVMGQVVIDNAKLSGEAQIGSGADYNAEMIVKNGAEVSLGGSSNSVVILGKSTKGTLTVDNATLNIKRCGKGAGYDVPADTFVIGYNGGNGFLNVSNNGIVNAQYNVQVSEGSEITVADSTLNIAGTLTNSGIVSVSGSVFNATEIANSGTVKVSGESTVQIGTYTGSQIRFYDATMVGDSKIGGNAFAFDNFTVEGTFEVKQINLVNTSVIKSGAKLTGSTTIVSAGGNFTLENGGEVYSRFFNVIGTADINGKMVLTHSDPRQKCLQVISGGIANINDGADITIDGHNAIVNEGGTLNLNGGTLNITKWANNINDPERGGILYNNGTINFAGGTVNMYTLNNAGTVNVSADDLITVRDLLGAGSIVIDASEFADNNVKTIVDVTNSTFTGSITVTGNDDAKVIYGEDGDIILTTLSSEVVYVDSAFAGATVGQIVADGKCYGLNAFDSLLNYTASADTTTLNIAGGTYSSEFNTTTDVSVLKGGISNVVADGDVTVDLGSLVFETEVAGEVTITGNFITTDTNTWSTEFGMMPYYNGAIQFKGTENTTFNLNGNFYAAEGFTFNAGKTVISADSEFTVDNQNCGQINVYGEVVNYGKMTVDLQKGSTLRLVNIGNGGNLILSGEDASLTTNIVNDQPWAGAQCVDFYVSNGTLTVEDGAEVSASGIVDVYANGTIDIDNATFAAGTVKQNGTMNVTGESTFSGEISGEGAINFADATLTDSTIVGDFSGEVNFAEDNVISGGTFNLANAELFADDGTLTINNGAEVTFGADYEVYANITVSDATLAIAGGVMDANIAVADGGTLILTDDLKLSSGVSVTLAGGTLTLNDAVITGAKGSVVMDYTSTIAFGNAVFAEGTFTVDVTGYENGSYRLFDYTGSEELAADYYQDMFGEDWNDSFIVANGDLYLTDIVQDVIYVNSAYTADTAWAEGKILGYNAFNNFKAAVDAQTAATTAIQIDSDIAVSGLDYLTGNLVSGNDNGVTITNDFVNYMDIEDLTVGAGVTFVTNQAYVSGNNQINGNVQAESVFYNWSDTVTTITGSVETKVFMSRYYADSTDGVYVVGNAEAGKAAEADVQVKATNYLGHYSGTFSVENAAVEFGYILLGHDTADVDGYPTPQLILNNASIKTIGGLNTQPGQVVVKNNAVITATNGSVLDFTGPTDFGYLSMASGTSMTLTDSTLKLGRSGQGTTSLYGTITLNGASAILSNGSIINVGVISVSADSTVSVAGTLTNNGTIELALGADFAINGLAGVGSITVDVSSYVTGQGEVKVIDYTGSTALTEADYLSVLGNTWSNAFYVVDGDLFYNRDDATHDVEITDDYIIPEGTELVVVDPGDTTLDSSTTNLAVNGIEAVVKSGTFNDTVSGGAIASSGEKAWDDHTFDTNLTVEDGTFNKVVMGGTRVEQGNSEQYGDSNLAITGGTFNSQIVGGMAYADSSYRGKAVLSGDVNLTISGGEIKSWIYGGSISSNGKSSCTLIEGNITITIDASSNAITFGNNAHIVAGSYQSGLVDGSTKVVFTGLSANLGIDADNLVWGGSSADVYVNGADGSRTFQTAVSGDRTVSFDAFSGDFTARIRGFNTFEAVNGADVTALAGSLSDIENWYFDTESSIAGSFVNDFAGDKFDVDVTGWDNNEATLFSGDATGFADMTVTLGGETAVWDAAISGYASTSYQLTFDAENKVVKFGALA